MEYVLVVKTEKLSQFISGRTGLVTESNAEMLDIIRAEHEFIPRPDAENDPGYKQIIPYVVLRRGDEIFMTRRLKKGGEARLHGLMSIGVGGHINPVDDIDRESVLLRGLERELDEEVEIERRGELHTVGFINDDTNGVGSVHLGLCYTLPVEGEVRVLETEKLEGGWTTAAELRENWDMLETWTQIALNGIDG